MIEWLTKPLAYEFLQRALLASTLVGVLCAVVGCYVVLRGMAFLGDALAHAILPGVALAYLLDGNLLLGALIAAIVEIARRPRENSEGRVPRGPGARCTYSKRRSAELISPSFERGSAALDHEGLGTLRAGSL